MKLTVLITLLMTLIGCSEFVDGVNEDVPTGKKVAQINQPLNFDDPVSCGDGYNLDDPDGLENSGDETCVDINECANPSEYCSDNSTCLNSEGSYYCACDSGFNHIEGIDTLISCIDINECSTGQHACSSNSTCSNTAGGYDCNCNPGFSASYDIDGNLTCVDVNECETLPNACPINSTCSNSEGAYSCNCNLGYEQSQDNDGILSCVDINECTNGTDQCSSNTTCSNTVGSYTCSCNEGFSTSYSGDQSLPENVQCTDINECNDPLQNNCNANATCSNTAGAYSCACNTGYNGDGVSCTAATCNATGVANSNYPDNFVLSYNSPATVLCNSGYNLEGDAELSCSDSGVFSGNASCRDIDECANGTDQCSSNATCSNTAGAYSCACNTGYNGDGLSCAAATCNATGVANSNQPNNFVVNYNSPVTVACNVGYSLEGNAEYSCSDLGVLSGNASCVDVNECTSGTDQCSSNTTCSNTIGSYTCSCNEGYSTSYSGDQSLPGSVQCTDINECSDALQNNCNANATCSNTAGAYSCACNTGYNGDGIDCTVATCNATGVANSNYPDNFAINYDSSATVLCDSGYSLEGDAELSCSGSGVLSGNASCIDVDECTSGTDQCSSNTTCSNTIGSYTCNCNEGYSTSYSGDQSLPGSVQCTDINECSDPLQNNCNANATCSNTAGAYSCACNTGFTGDGLSCAAATCNATGVANSNQPNNFVVNYNSPVTVACNAGYSLEGNAEYSCSDTGLLTGSASCVDINECDLSSSCSSNTTCSNTIGSYTCSCNEGYSTSYSGDQSLPGSVQCTDINECSDPLQNNCNANATCSNTAGAYSCACNTGFTGDGLSCSPVTCDATGVPNSNQPNNFVVNYNSPVTVVCNSGYSLEGNAEYSCSDTGALSGSASCRDIAPPAIVSIEAMSTVVAGETEKVNSDSSFKVTFDEPITLTSGASFRVRALNPNTGGWDLVGFSSKNYISLSEDQKSATFNAYSNGTTTSGLVPLPYGRPIYLQLKKESYQDGFGNLNPLTNSEIDQFVVEGCDENTVQNENSLTNTLPPSTSGGTSTIICSPGHVGSETFTCQPSGDWSGSLVCSEEDYDTDVNLSVNNRCYKTGKNGNLHQIGTKLVEVNNYQKNGGIIQGACILHDLNQGKEYESMTVNLACNSEGKLNFATDGEKNKCTDFSTAGDVRDEMNCDDLGFASNSGSVYRSNISHFYFSQDSVVKNIFFEEGSPPGENEFGFEDIDLINSFGVDVIQNLDILKNPLGMFYAACKLKTNSDPALGNKCAWENPGAPECYGKFDPKTWAKYIESPVSLGPLNELVPGYSGSLTMNSLKDYNQSTPVEDVTTYIIETTINYGNTLFDYTTPRVTSAYFFHPDFDISNTNANSKIESDVFTGNYTSTLFESNDSISVSKFTYEEFYKYSHKAAVDEYITKVFDDLSNASGFMYKQKYTFKRNFSGELALPKFNKFHSRDSEIVKRCGGDGCRHIIISGDSSKCDGTPIDETEIYCFPSENIRIFKSNDSFFIDDNNSKIFYFDGYDSITMENLSLELYPSSKFFKLYNWYKEKEGETDTSAYGNQGRASHYNLTAKGILSNYIAPYYAGKTEVLIRPKSNVGNLVLDYMDSYYTLLIEPVALSKSSLAEIQFVRLGNYFKPTGDYGDRLFDTFYKRVSSGTKHVDGIYCDGIQGSNNLVGFSQVAINTFSGAGDGGYKVLEDIISRCESKYQENTNSNSGFNIDTNGFWYNVVKQISEGLNFDAEIHQLGGFIHVKDSKSFKMNNVRVKAIVAESVIDLYSQYADIHGNTFEGVSGDDMINRLSIPLLDEDRGIANLIYHQEGNSSEVQNALSNKVFANSGVPLTILQNPHPFNDMATTPESFFHLGSVITIGNHWNGTPEKNYDPVREIVYDFPFMSNPCINLVLNRQNNSFCEDQWDDLWVKKDDDGKTVELTTFQKYSPFFAPTTTLPKTGLIDGASYNNRGDCVAMTAEFTQPLCNTSSAPTCNSGHMCTIMNKNNLNGYCLKHCTGQSDCASNEQCMEHAIWDFEINKHAFKKICKSNMCDNQFSSIISNEIKNGTKPNSMAYMSDDHSGIPFDRNANLDGIILKSTNGIIFNNIVKDYNYDTLYDLNQRGENVEEGIIPKTIIVKRNFFQNGATKNTGSSWPQHKIHYINNLYYNVTVGGYWVLYTPMWAHNSFIIPGDVQDKTRNFNANFFANGFIFSESSPSETPPWHNVFGHRITFMNNSILNAKKTNGLLKYGKFKNLHMGMNFRFKGNLFLGDYEDSIVYRDDSSSSVGRFASDSSGSYCYQTYIFSDFEFFQDDNGTPVYSANSCNRLPNDYVTMPGSNVINGDLDDDGNGIIDIFESSSYMAINESGSSPFKTYVDASSTPTINLSKFNLTYSETDNHLNYYTPLKDGNGRTYSLSDFNNRFELLDLCLENIENQDSWTYRCIAGDLTSIFKTSSELGGQFASYFGTTDNDSTTIDDGGLLGNLLNFNNTIDYVQLFDPNQEYVLKHDSGTIDYCDQASSEMRNVFENSRMNSFNVGKSIYRHYRDFSGQYRLVKSASGAFEIPAGGIDCP